MEFVEEALVLQVGRFREADLWVRFFSPSRGVLTGFAFGGAKSRRRFCGCLDPLNRLLVRASSDRLGRYLNLHEATLVRGLDRLRRDWRRYGQAMNCMRFVQAVAVAPDGSRETYQLAVSAVNALEDLAGDAHPAFPMFFRARLAHQQGYGPELAECARCRRPVVEASSRARVRFLAAQGRALCPRCRPEPGVAALEVSAEAVRLLERVRASEPAAWPDLATNDAASRECSLLVDRFVAYHLGLAWDKGDFRRV